jgi:hypothetical protein
MMMGDDFERRVEALGAFGPVEAGIFKAVLDESAEKNRRSATAPFVTLMSRARMRQPLPLSALTRVFLVREQ